MQSSKQDQLSLGLKELGTRYGLFSVPDTDDLIANSIVEYGEWAQNEIELLRSFISVGSTVIDGGACFGTHARAFSDAVGGEGQVICFEPSPANRSILEKNAALAQFQNISIRPDALSDAKGSGSLNAQIDGNAGASSVVKEGNDVSFSTIDAACKQKVDFIKLDLEGFEIFALRGASKTLKEDRPVVFCEVLTVEDGSHLIQLMGEFGYQSFGVHTLAYNPDNFNGSTKNLFGKGEECGLVFLPKERVDSYQDVLSAFDLPEIGSVDDLVLLLLQQPQYAKGILSEQSAGDILPNPFIELDEQAEAFKREAGRARVLEAEVEQARAIGDEEAAKAKAFADQLNALQAKVSEQSNRLGMQITSLEQTVEQWRAKENYSHKLMRRVQKFPFLLYFKANKGHRRSIRSFRNGPMLADVADAQIEAIKQLNGAGSATAAKQGAASANQWQSARSTMLSRTGVPVLEAPQTPPVRVINADQIAQYLRDGRDKIVVSFSHDDYKTVTGGTQACIEIESKNAEAVNADYLNVHPVRACNTLLPADEAGKSVFRLRLNGEELGAARYDELKAAIEARHGDSQKFDFVIHHLLGHSPEMIADIISMDSSAACFFWLHDYFSVCPSYTLRRNNMTFCGAPDPDTYACRVCVYGQSRELHTRRIRDFFERLNPTVVSPSQVAADLWKKASDYSARDLVVHPHMTIEETPRTIELPKQDVKSPIRVAYLGAPVAHKGWDLFINIVADCSDRSDLEFHYFGKEDPNVGMTFHPVDVATQSDDAMIHAVASAGIDLVLHFANWPETFSFTTAEALAGAAYVVTTSDSGNVAALVERTGRGKVLTPDDNMSSWLLSAECRSLVENARNRNQLETLSVQYSKMTIDLIKAAHSK